MVMIQHRVVMKNFLLQLVIIERPYFFILKIS
jgi:hypothetical protein